MAIIITDMDMPKSCDCCKFSNYHDGDDYCELFKILNGCSWRAKDVKWNEDCPLKSTDEIIADINEALEFWSQYKDSPLVRDLVSTIHQYCDPSSK